MDPKKFGLALLAVALLSTQVLAVVVTISANGTLINKDGGQTATGSYVQVISSDNDIAGPPNVDTGDPEGDILEGDITSVNPDGTYNSGISINSSRFIYLRVWDGWNGTGTPTGFYATTALENVGTFFVYTYLPSTAQTDWIEFSTAPPEISDEALELNGSDITISWTTDPVGSGVDIWTKTGYYSQNPADWPATPEYADNNSGTVTETGVVGNGIHKYYKIVVAGTDKAEIDFSTNIFGKFDLDVAPGEVDPNKFFISLPLEVADNSLPTLIGDQVTEMDMVITFDINKNVTSGTMYTGGSWVEFPGIPVQITNLEAGYTYGYITSVDKYITVIGKVKESNYSRTLNGGADLTAQWIANPYPTSVAIGDAGLNASSHNANPMMVGTVYNFDANAELINGTDGLAFHTAATEWKEGTLSNPSPMVLEPGRGNMLTEPVQASFDWTLDRP